MPSYSDGTQALWEGIIADFEADNPDINVNLEVQSWDNINDVVRNKVQSNEAPDILNIDAFAGFAGDDLLYKADEVVVRRRDRRPPGLLQVENASIDGTQYGLPLIASARTMFVNTDLLEQAGVHEIPTTWDQLLEASKKISDLGGGVSGYGMPLGSEEAQAETSIWTFGAGGSWGDSSELTIDTPESQEAVSFMKQMIDEGATQDDPGSTDRTPLINVFVQGKIGFIEALPPTVDQIATENPDLNYELAPIPTKDGSPVTLGVADHLMAFKNDECEAGVDPDVPRLLLLDRRLQQLRHHREVPAGDGVRCRGVRATLTCRSSWTPCPTRSSTPAPTPPGRLRRAGSRA